ncbi:MAG TPA: hypothetical protein VFI46_12315, partial [Jiangellaceae bacterium]|nr:hypothetical protein [Jiangellaceae bacterium]
REHAVGAGVFLILVARAPATVWKVSRTGAGVIRNLEQTRQFVNHYSLHIMDPTWGHLTIKMSGRPPFGAQVILTGHEYVACTARAAGLRFAKEGNCFTRIGDPERLARVADTLSQPGTIGRLSQVIDRWIYTACLCFGLDLDEQPHSGFGYPYSVYQVEYSRNLIFASGAVMDKAFDTVVDRTRARLDVPRLRTLFGVGQRPRRTADTDLSPRQAVVIERPRWNLTLFKVHFGILDQLPAPSQIGATRVGGVDVNKPRTRTALAAILALAVAPDGFTVADLAAKVRSLTGQTDLDYTVRQAAYDLRKLRGKQLVVKPGRTRRYQVPGEAARTITALLTLRDHVIAPILAGVRSPRMGRKPAAWAAVDRDYEQIRIGMQTLFADLGISAAAAA